MTGISAIKPHVVHIPPTPPVKPSEPPVKHPEAAGPDTLGGGASSGNSVSVATPQQSTQTSSSYEPPSRTCYFEPNMSKGNRDW